MRPSRLASAGPRDEPGGRQAASEREEAVKETREVLARASRVWSGWRCGASGQCCQLRATGRAPWLWPTEWLVLLEALEAAGRELPPARADGGCPFLDAEGRRCTVYEARPAGCRTYFCERGRGPPLPGLSTHRLLDVLTAINVGLDPSAQPRPLPDWVTRTGGTTGGP